MKRYSLFTLAILICCIAGCSGIQTAEYYPPPGVLYDIGGYQLHLQCRGKGSPTVVMAAGSADFSLTWALVAPEIAKNHRVVTYDRAGLGWSEASPYTRLATIEVAELHALLEKAGIPPPYVMVGHSAGGVLVRLFAHIYPSEISGMVLVDPGHEEQKTRQEAAVQAAMDAPVAAILIRLNDFAVRSAAGTLTEADISSMINANLPATEQAEYSYIYRTRPVHWQTVIAETNSLDASFAGVKNEHITTLGDIPLIVLSSSASMNLTPDPVLSAKADTVLRQLQQETADQSTKGQRRTVAGTTHFIQLVKPQAVIDAIREVL